MEITMKLASLKSDDRDGALMIVSRDLKSMHDASAISPNLRHAIEHCTTSFPLLMKLAGDIEDGILQTEPYDPTRLSSPLPRSFQWADGSAYLSHMRLVREARGAEMPPNSEIEPLLYQGGSDYFLGPTDDIICPDTSWGLDFESEIAIITDDVPMGCSVSEAPSHIKLVMLCNDISLRLIMKPELAKGFGFYQSKPASAFSPVCVTLDEIGDHWDTARINLPLKTTYNGKTFGNVHAGKDLNFDFAKLIAHAAKTRELRAGTIIGSGTVSNTNYDEVGSSCLAERRMIETLETGQPVTRFMEPGDTVRIEMIADEGKSIFGAIDQTVTST